MRVVTKMLLAGWIAGSAQVAIAATSQVPLHLSSTPSPNVLFNMSVESPMGGAAYNDQPGQLARGSTCNGRDSGLGICYFEHEVYLGIFDPDKCYTYDSSGGYFEPAAAATATRTCSSQFSGNMLNWATMTATDMFVWTMTGGNRVTDTNTLTVLERAKKNAGGGDAWFPHKYLNSSKNVSPSTVTPWPDSGIYIYNTDFGVKFSTTKGGAGLGAGTYNVRVKVCDTAVSLEKNCVRYGTYYKPEGLIQKNASRMRFGVTSYSLDNAETRDGGILRSNMKYVGPTMPDGSGGTVANPNAEYTVKGLLVANPNASDASASGVTKSGVINYLNEFSEFGYKSKDPASELFYESLRYFKNIGRTPEYANGLTNAQLGGFPAVTTWQDPIEYSCQKNFILGINDANPWLDKKLPGTHFTSSVFNGYTLKFGDYGQPSNPDPDINVRDLTDKVGQLEGLNETSQCVGCTNLVCDSDNNGSLETGANEATNKTLDGGLGRVMGTCPAAWKENSYYIAGLAYYANTTDLRTEGSMPGKQTVNSFFIDTQEYGTNPLTGQMNMLWLAGKYGGFVDSNGNGIPDLASEWDSDADGEPDNYVMASRPDKLVKALSGSFSEIEKRSSSVSAVTTSSTRLNSSTKAYQARFNSGDWSGDLTAYPVQSNGSVGTPDWNAAAGIPLHGARDIFSFNGTSGFEFVVGQNSTINALMASAGVASLTDAQINYLRGDHSAEQKNNGALRDRSSRLGDIVNSDPLHVGHENFGYDRLLGDEGSAYLTFRKGNTYQQRTKMVYVGANDGMLHGFGASDGVEQFAYIPKTVYPYLADLTNPSYSHRYFVDGSPVAGDAYFDHDNNGSKSWRTLLVGTTGAGGSGVFALDVTDPATFSASNVLWEVNSSLTGFADLGDTLGRASIVRLPDGHFHAVFGNGFNSSTGNAVIYVVRLDGTGALNPSNVTVIDTKTSGTGNGMAAPIVVDTNGDFIGDTIYAGDLKGNLWKAEYKNSGPSTPSVWKYSFGPANSPDPLYQARDASSAVQPITSRPAVRKLTDGKLMVYFGTGKYFETNDNVVGATPPIQSIYAIKDLDNSSATGRSDLLEQQVLLEATSGNFNVRITTNHAISSQKGWFMDLKLASAAAGLGERIINTPLLRGDRVIFTTVIPNGQMCGFGGASWLMELDSRSGSRLSSSPFDVNEDGVFDNSDNLTATINGTTESFPISGIQRAGMGIIDNPAVLAAPGHEVKIMGGSSGTIDSVKESSASAGGRQSWQQLQ